MAFSNSGDQELGEFDDPMQSQRFIEAAKAEGIEDVGEAFNRALGVIAPARKPEPKAEARKPKRAKRG